MHSDILYFFYHEILEYIKIVVQFMFRWEIDFEKEIPQMISWINRSELIVFICSILEMW